MFQRLILELFFVFEHVLQIQFFYLDIVLLLLSDALGALDVCGQPQGFLPRLDHAVASKPLVRGQFRGSVPIVVNLLGDNTISLHHR